MTTSTNATTLATKEGQQDQRRITPNMTMASNPSTARQSSVWALRDAIQRREAMPQNPSTGYSSLDRNPQEATSLNIDTGRGNANGIIGALSTMGVERWLEIRFETRQGLALFAFVRLARQGGKLPDRAAVVQPGSLTAAGAWQNQPQVALDIRPNSTPPSAPRGRPPGHHQATTMLAHAIGRLRVGSLNSLKETLIKCKNVIPAKVTEGNAEPGI